MPRRPAQLITELLSLAQSQGWTTRDLADELGMDETALSRLRSGERYPSKNVLVKIVQRFGERKFVRDLLWAHFYAECAPASGANVVDPFAHDAFTRPVQRMLRTYVETFAEECAQGGRGLYLCGADPNALAHAVRALRTAFEAARVRLVILRADRTPSAADARGALASPLVIVERLDFACDAVLGLLRSRADLLRPIIATSMQAPDDLRDPYMRRIAKSLLHRVDLSPVEAKTSLPVVPHAA